MYRFSMAVVFAFTLCDVVAAQNDCRSKDCYDLKCYGMSKAKDGPHTIYPDTPQLPSLQVSCDQETDGGGWIMYQRRVDGTVSFTDSWEKYKYGFGDHGDNATELWLGNEHVYQVLQSYGSTEWELRIEADAYNGMGCWVVASNFRMNNEALRYTVDWDNVSASIVGLGADWNYHKLIPFNTLDNMEGDADRKWCVVKHKGGWWYGYRPSYDFCTAIFLNGEYEKQPVESYMSISTYSFRYHVALQRSRMMFLRQNDVRPCNNPCKNGGACEYNVATNSAKCSCDAGFKGATCEHTDNGAGSDADRDTDSDADSGSGSTAGSGSGNALVAGGVGLLLLLMLIAGAISHGVTRCRKQREADAAAQWEREKEEEGGLFSFFGL